MSDDDHITMLLGDVSQGLATLSVAIEDLAAQINQGMEPTSLEILSEADLAGITGYKLPSRQIEWLVANRWQHVLTGANRPVVGRVYARLKLAGVKPTAAHAVADTWTLDISKVG